MNAFFRSGLSLFPFIKDLKTYSFSSFKSDLISAISVAFLAIPQSIAYALLAGLPPISGLLSAIFGSIFSASFGSSKHLVAGPSTGISILIQTTIAEILHIHYPTISTFSKEAVVLNILTHMVIMIGLVQFLFSFLNLGKALQFVSRSVMLGYFAGIAIAIVINQSFYFLGLDLAGGHPIIFKAKNLIMSLSSINIVTVILGILSILILVFLKKIFKKLPNALIMIIIIGLLSYLLNDLLLYKNPIHTLKSMGYYNKLSISLQFPFFDFKLFYYVFTPSIAIALLAVLEVFSVSRGLAVRSGQYVNANQEVYGLGISNIILSFLTGAMPASGSISRSWLNYHSYAKTRFSAVMSGLIVLILTLVGWPLIQFIPLVALSAILFVIIPKIVDIKSIKLCLKATKGDALVFFITMLSCLVFSLEIAFYIGIIISIVFFLKKAYEPYFVEYAFNQAGRLKVVSSKFLVHRKIRIIGIGGELFFAAVDFLQEAMISIAEDPYVDAIILKLNSIYHVDASICFAIMQLNEYLKKRNKILLISGLTKEVWKTLQKTHVVTALGQDRLFLTDETNPQLSTWEAYQFAEELINKLP